MRNIVLAVVGMLGTFLYNGMQTQEVVPQPVQEVGQTLPDFFLPQTTDEVKQIEAEVKEIAPKLGAANDQLAQSISALSRQIGQMHSEMVSRESVDEMITQKTMHFVSMQTLTSAIDETKEQLKTAASACNCECEEKIAAILKRLDALEAKCAACAPTAAAPATTSTASYGSYSAASSPVKATSGSSNGTSRPAGHSYYTDPSTGILMQCYREPAIESSSYSVSSPVVSSGGCTGTVSYSQPAYQQASMPVQSTVVAMPQETREVRIVEPRQRRSVSTAEIPVAPTAMSFETCDPNDPNSACARAAASQAVQSQPRPRIGDRLFRGR